jgi:methyl-accepting chemotaxis protein
MSALMHGARPAHVAPLPTPARGNGFFSHHGLWAPGVRLFRRLAFASKAAIISLAFMLPMLGLLGWTLQNQADQSLQARRDALRQHVQLAHGLLTWAHAQETQGSLSRDQAQQLALQALRPMQLEDGERFWVQDPQSKLLLPGSPDGTAQTLSHALRFDPWSWTIGSSMSVADLRQARWHGLAWIGGVVALAMLASGYLFLSFYRVMDGGLRETRRHLRAMSDGDLTTSPRPWGKDESAQLMFELSRMQASLRSMVHSVRRSSDGIVMASDEVAGGAADLSARTRHAAAALEQSTRAMKQIAVKVSSDVTHIEEASRVARHNAEIAEDGGGVMREMVDTMQGISTASARIGEIIGTIDGIAFRTNILALNAAVEAARAGEQGRGFAVVAHEVRMLAKRSAEAAKEIKALIGGSVQQVRAGTVVVHKAGTAMQQIVAASQRVSELLGEVAAGAREQSQGIGQVDQAVTELDQVLSLIHIDAADDM